MPLPALNKYETCGIEPSEDAASVVSSNVLNQYLSNSIISAACPRQQTGELVMPITWYLRRDEKEHGPFSLAQLKQLATSGRLSPGTHVRLGTDGDWMKAQQARWPIR